MPQHDKQGGEDEAAKINKGFTMQPGSKEMDTSGNFAEGSPAQGFLQDYYSQPTVELPGGGAEEGAYGKGMVAKQADYAQVSKNIQGSIKEAGEGLGAAIQPKGKNLTEERKRTMVNKANDPKATQKQRDRRKGRLLDNYGIIPGTPEAVEWIKPKTTP